MAPVNPASVEERGAELRMTLKLFAYGSELNLSEAVPGELSLALEHNTTGVCTNLQRTQVETLVGFLEAWLRELDARERGR